MNSKTLHYVIFNPRGPITLDLYESERYEAAIVVQSLVGNLVYYSNYGRYEPRLAKRWKRESPTSWKFELHSDLECENGEKITASGFKQSIERSLKVLSISGPFPVLSMLKGYQAFLTGANEIEGIQVDGNFITFEFDRPVRDGVLQVLSFAPFGYICSENLDSEGKWKNNMKFVSSGPYRVSEIEIGKRYVLVRRENWRLPFSSTAPGRVEFSHDIPVSYDGKTWIIDSFTNTVKVPGEFKNYPLVPEYINPIVLGNLHSGYFSNIENRKKFKSILEKIRSTLPERWDSHTRSQFFYPNIALNFTRKALTEEVFLPKPKAPLIIEGEEPKEGTPRFYAWKVLRLALEASHLPFRFENNPTTWKDMTDMNYDIRLRGASSGCGPEAWGLHILFCSEVGIKFPDPSNAVSDLIKRFDAEEISEEEFGIAFVKAVDNDHAIIPVSHFGVQLYLSPQINQEVISPTLSIMRFDQLEINWRFNSTQSGN